MSHLPVLDLIFFHFYLLCRGTLVIAQSLLLALDSDIIGWVRRTIYGAMDCIWVGNRIDRKTDRQTDR